MQSIGMRLALWYALASAVTLAGAALTGFYLLEQRLVHNLDEFNQTQFQRLRTVLRPDFTILDPEQMAGRLRNATEGSSGLFYVQVGYRAQDALFATENLNEQAIPATAGPANFDLDLPGVGELRVGRFALGSLTVHVASSLAPVRAVRTIYVKVSAVLVAVMAVVSCALGLGLSRIALRPVRAIQRTAEHISSDNLSERIPVGKVKDEISNLARLLNRTFGRLEASFRQVRRFAAEASHELKTPLALARVHAEKLLGATAGTPGHDEAVQNILEELARLEKIIEELLLLSRAEAHAIPLELQALDPQPFIETFLQDARVLGEYRGMRIEAAQEGTGRAEFDPKWMRQVFLNLLTNALRASPPGGLITIASWIDQRTWCVTMEDDGPGVPADQLERIFERFHRLVQEEQADDKGSGLGLAISRSFIMLHGGRIRAERPEKGRGLRVVVELPALAAERVRQAVEGAGPHRVRQVAN